MIVLAIHETGVDRNDADADSLVMEGKLNPG